jgi:signal peptidase II
MFYFPLVSGRFPDWFPVWGGQNFAFFREVFNIADSAITIGVLALLIFQKKFYKESHPDNSIEVVTGSEATSSSSTDLS